MNVAFLACARTFGLGALAVLAAVATAGCSAGGSSATPGAQADTGSPAQGTSGDAGVSSESGSDAAAGPWFDGNAPPLTANVTIHIAGDSTAAIFPPTDPTHRVGWGAVFQQFFAAGVTVDDAALSGRSSKSFIDEGAWAKLKAKIQPGDYVFIEFGHNDEKVGDAPRYTNPATTFRDYLKVYVGDTLGAGGVPVLLTPISRREFSGSMISPSHGAYPAAVIAVGQETGAPVIDMTEKTRVWLEGLGPTASIPFFAQSDNTHLSAMGAPEVGKLVVAGIRELQLPLVARLNP
jgi:lysophospholipase L1-like esterase